MAEQENQFKHLTIKWDLPDNLVTRYANNVVVQHNIGEFLISFFEIKPPILLGTEDEVKAAFQDMNEIKAECVSRIMLTPHQVMSLIDTLQTNVDRYQARFGEIKKDDDANSE